MSQNPTLHAGKGAGVTEQEARAVAEASRESAMTAPSFVLELFLGRLVPDLIHPYPEPDAAEQERARPFLEKLERFMREEVDDELIEREGRIPEHLIQRLREMGAFGIKIPVEYGGLGLSQFSYGKAVSLVGTKCGAMVALLSAHQSIGVPQPLKLFGTEEQKKRLLPRLAKGAISAFALTESDVGSDPARMATTAEPTPDGTAYILNGEKLWCTNGTIAELMVVMARTPAREGKRGGISAFIIENAWPGVEVTQRCEFMGIRGIENAQLRFHNVRVPKENLLWGEGRGLKLALVTLNTGRLTLPATCSAAGKWCIQVARQFAAARVQWGRPVGHHEAVAQMISDITARSYAMESVADLASMLADAGRSDIRLEAAIAKMWNSDTAWEVCDETLQVRGGRGYETASSLAARGEAPVPLERLMRELRINRIFEGTNQVMRLFIAREALDPHLRVAGDAVMPGVPMNRRLAAFVRAGLFYATWYPSRWFGFDGWFGYGTFGRLAGHMRWIARTSRRLARAQFHLMMQHGPALEKKQAQLFRCVDIGAELFAMAATCARAQRDARDAANRGVIEVADLFCRDARRRVDGLFRAIRHNHDGMAYGVARGVLDRMDPWMGAGVIEPPPEHGTAEGEAGEVRTGAAG